METVFTLVVVGVVLLVQLIAWVVGGLLLLFGLRFVYRFVTAPREGPTAPPAVYAPPPQPTPPIAPQPAPVVRPPEPASAVVAATPSPSAAAPSAATATARRPGLDFSRYLDYARWGATAGVITTLVDIVQSVFTATGLQGDARSGSDAEFDPLAMIAAVLVFSAPVLWLSWSLLRKPRAWKGWTILVLICLSLLGGAWDVFMLHDQAGMLELFPNTVAFWYAVQAVRGRRAAVAASQGRDVDPVGDPSGIWTSNFARAAWGGILLLAFVGDFVNHHHPVQAAPRLDTETASTTTTNTTTTATPAPLPTASPVVSPAAPSTDEQPDIIPAPNGSRPPPALVQAWGQNEEACRGSDTPDAPDTLAACTVRDNAYEQLNKLGWCRGREDEVEAAYRWQRCAPGTNGYKDAPEGKGTP